MKKSDAIMKPQEVAEYLRIPIRTLCKLCNEGKVPATRVGKHWFFGRKRSTSGLMKTMCPASKIKDKLRQNCAE